MRVHVADGEPEQPRAEAPRFAVLNASDERRTAALANWKTVLGEQGAAAAPPPELRPVTATLASLPAGLSNYPRLPLVVMDKDEKTQSDEETRESLRRFLGTAAPLLGIELKHLSLIEVSDAGGGARRALYRQTPFAYPLRNGYGVVEVTFTPDLRVVGLSSTAIPDAEPLARSLAAVQKPLTAEQAVAALVNRTVTYNARGGAQQTLTLDAGGRRNSAPARRLPRPPRHRSPRDARTPRRVGGRDRRRAVSSIRLR